MIHIGVIGVGGVGGYFGGKLTKIKNRKEMHLSFIARGEHLKAIKGQGLCLKTKEEGTFCCQPDLVTDDFKALPVLDICFLTVKAYDLSKVLGELKGKVTAQTQIIPLLNGVDIAERVKAVFPEAIVYPACVYVGTHIESPGVVTQNGGSCTIVFGADWSHMEVVPDELMKLMTEASIRYQWQQDSRPAIWEKFMFIAAYGMVTACYDQSIGQVYEAEDRRADVAGIMNEIAMLAEKEQVELAEDCIIQALGKATVFPYMTKTSFQRDYEKHQGRDERESFSGAIIKLADKWQIPVSFTRRIDSLLMNKR